MARKVKRTYFSKKLGKMVTKEYTYEHKSRKGKTLVDKRGRVNKKNLQAFKDEINSRDDLLPNEKRMLEQDLDALVNQRKQDNKKLTTSGFWGKEANTNVERLLANAGYSVEEVSEMYGIDEDELLNEENWKGDQFTYKGRSFALQFGYTINIFKEII